MKFGTLIRAHRLRQNLSMDRICKKVELSKAYLSLIETGQKGPPKDEIVVQIARALGVDEQDLLLRAHRERFPEDVMELRRVAQEMRAALERLSSATVDQEKPPESASGTDEQDLTGDFLAEMGAAPPPMPAEQGAIRCAKVLRSALQDLERLLPPDMNGGSELASEIEDLRAEERQFLLHVIQGIKQLRPRRGPQTVIDD